MRRAGVRIIARKSITKTAATKIISEPTLLEVEPEIASKICEREIAAFQWMCIYAS